LSFPGQPKGFISGIVAKEFLIVAGDKNSTVEELLQRGKRFILQLPSLRMFRENNRHIKLVTAEMKEL
jgi:hypothetical protein